MKKHLTLLFILFIIGQTLIAQHKLPIVKGQDNNQVPCGVWANSNCELVQTQKYTLLFSRNSDTISATLRRIEQEKGVNYSIFVSGYNFFVSTKECEKIKPTASNSKVKFTDFISLENGTLIVKSPLRPLNLNLIEKIDICPPYKMPLGTSQAMAMMYI